MSVGDVRLPFRSIWQCSVKFQEGRTCAVVREAGHFYLWVFNTNFFVCESSTIWRGEKTSLEKRHIIISQRMCAMLRADCYQKLMMFSWSVWVSYLGPAWWFTTCVHGWLSNWVGKLSCVLVFFLVLVFFWVKGWDKFLDACGGAAMVRCTSRKRKINEKENRSHLFSVAANCWVGLVTHQHFFFVVNFNKSYGATQASKLRLDLSL